MARPARAEEVQTERKRRRDDTVDRTYNLKLALPAEFRDDKDHEYRWINDRNSRVHDLTEQDDWQICQPANGDRDKICKVVDVDRAGKPVNAYLVRKPKDWYDDDKRKAATRAAEAEKAPLTQAPADVPGSYVTPGASITRKGAYAP